jgi:hypothetical protein
MMKPFLLLILMIALFELAAVVFGYALTYQVGYGAFSILALTISATFLWLWYQRSTPLALGMAIGWGGAAGVMAWWWVFNTLEQPEWMQGNPLLFVFLSLYLVGALLHLEVIGRSFNLSLPTTLAPIFGAFLFSILVAVMG